MLQFFYIKYIFLFNSELNLQVLCLIYFFVIYMESYVSFSNLLLPFPYGASSFFLNSFIRHFGLEWLEWIVHRTTCIDVVPISDGDHWKTSTNSLHIICTNFIYFCYFIIMHKLSRVLGDYLYWICPILQCLSFCRFF